MLTALRLFQAKMEADNGTVFRAAACGLQATQDRRSKVEERIDAFLQGNEKSLQRHRRAVFSRSVTTCRLRQSRGFKMEFRCESPLPVLRQFGIYGR